MAIRLTRRSENEIRHASREPFNAVTLEEARRIVDDVRGGGLTALRRHAERLGDVMPGAPLIASREELEAAVEALDDDTRGLLERVAGRIRAFAVAQRAALRDLEVSIAGGFAGHRVLPVERVGCYAPGGRYPLISSVLMTVITARVAGVREVWVAAPKPTAPMLAAAAIAGADGLLAVGGAQAIAALASGIGVPACDMVVGPGNRWVTAAKWLVSREVAIDMLAGPSELLIIADERADPACIAADLLAQAEHDTDAAALLVTPAAALIETVETELERQLSDLPTAEVARESLLRNGLVVQVEDFDEAARVSNALSPEHVSLHVEEATGGHLLNALHAYGALFIGGQSAEAFGDYGAGPNHVLPTGGAARHAAGLSVLSFLRPRTWLRLNSPAAELTEDVAALARLERLEGHARSAELRCGRKQ